MVCFRLDNCSHQNKLKQAVRLFIGKTSYCKLLQVEEKCLYYAILPCIGFGISCTLNGEMINTLGTWTAQVFQCNILSLPSVMIQLNILITCHNLADSAGCWTTIPQGIMIGLLSFEKRTVCDTLSKHVP